MRRSLTFMCILVFCSGSASSGQELNGQTKQRAVIVPPDIILTVIAHQPDCPLQLTKALHIAYLGGGGGEIHQVENRGAKAIRAYAVAELISTGTGNRVDDYRAGGTKSKLLMPGQTSPHSAGTEVELILLTDELRDKLKLRRPMKAVAVFMIVRVEFADGTEYNDEATFKALQAYFERVGAKVDTNQ